MLSILSIDLIKHENNLLAFGGLKSLNTSLYAANFEHIEMTLKMDGAVQNEPEIIIKAIENIELVFARIRSAAPEEARVFGQALSQIVNDLLPACEILTRLLKEFINSNQENIFVIAEIIHKVKIFGSIQPLFLFNFRFSFKIFRQTIESSHLMLLRELITSGMGMESILQFRNSRKSIWAFTVVLISATCNPKLLKMFPILLDNNSSIEDIEVLFLLSLRDLLIGLNAGQKQQFRDVFAKLFKVVFGTGNFVEHKL